MVTRWDDDANPELAWFECSIEQLAVLRERALNELGESPALVHGLVGWIVGADVNSASNQTRSTYRKILRELGPPSSNRPKGRRRSSAGQRGLVRPRLLAAAGAGGTVLAMAAHTGPVGASVAALVAAPIILGESSETAQEATQGVIRIADRARTHESRGLEPELVPARAA